MQEYCHRCGGELPGDTQFCPHCGAPQLTLALEQQSVEAGGERPDGEAASTGAMPPPMPRVVDTAVDTIDWRVAIRYAVAVAAVGAVLSLAAVKVDILSLPSVLWMVSASMITLGLYQKRLPAARIDAGIGARIGVMVGLCLALGLAASMAGWGLFERYVLHGMGSFDAQMTASILMSRQWMVSHAMTITPEMTAYSNSAEYRAALGLSYFVFGGGLLMVISAIGGAFGGSLRTRRK